MLNITNHLSIPLSEISISPIRAQGAGGQNVNKVSTAIHLRFNILESTLPTQYKIRLLDMRDERISNDGIIIIKAQRYRSQEQNKADAMQRLTQIIQSIIDTPKKRRKTKASKNAVRKRLDNKTHRGNLKKMRRTPE